MTWGHEPDFERRMAALADRLGGALAAFPGTVDRAPQRFVVGFAVFRSAVGNL